MPNLIEFLNSVQSTGESVMVDADSVNAYTPFVINRGIAQHKDCLFFAEAINQLPCLDKEMQYDFYMCGLSKKRRYGKWAKKAEFGPDTKMIAEHFQVSMERAMEYHVLLSEEQLDVIRNSEGGRIGKPVKNKKVLSKS